MRDDRLAEQFEENRGYLRGVAYRMLGSLSEADETPCRKAGCVSAAPMQTASRICAHGSPQSSRISVLDMLRSRKSRSEEPLEAATPVPAAKQKHAASAEAEVILADSVGFATLVVLDRLNPAERIAFVLHDVFDIPFEEIARIAGRTPEAARQLASRARRRIRGVTALPEKDLARQRSLTEKFLSALRLGDPAKLLEVLDPAFSVQADAVAAPQGVPADMHDAEAWAKQAVQSARGARLARLAMVNGSVGLIVAPRGRLFRVLRFTYSNDRIATMEIIGDPERLRTIEINELES